MQLKSLTILVLGLAFILTACGGDSTSGIPLSTENGQAILDGATCDEEKPSTCAGADQPDFALEDFQPASPFFGESYGLERFQGKVTFVSLWAAWCGYCRTQAEYMETIHAELKDLGVDINVVAINVTTGVDTQDLLAETCSFPLIQDTDEINAWNLMNGSKDDMFVYDAEGKLLIHLPAASAVATNLSTEQGYANVRDLLYVVAPPANETQNSPE